MLTGLNGVQTAGEEEQDEDKGRLSEEEMAQLVNWSTCQVGVMVVGGWWW